MGKHTSILLFLSIFLVGCNSAVNVDVDAICSTSAKEKCKYILVPGNDHCSSQDLQFLEFANCTDKALEDTGFVKVTSEEEADVAIILSYGISDPQPYQQSYSLPVWGKTGWDSSYGVIGSTNHLSTSFLFLRSLSLMGVEPENYKKKNELVGIWSTNAVSMGESGDLRKIFPYLLAASKLHFADNTGGKVKYKIKVTEPNVYGKSQY